MKGFFFLLSLDCFVFNCDRKWGGEDRTFYYLLIASRVHGGREAGGNPLLSTISWLLPSITASGIRAQRAAFYYLLIASPRQRNTESGEETTFLLSFDCFLSIKQKHADFSHDCFLLSFDCFTTRQRRRGGSRRVAFYYLLIASVEAETEEELREKLVLSIISWLLQSMLSLEGKRKIFLLSLDCFSSDSNLPSPTTSSFLLSLDCFCVFSVQPPTRRRTFYYLLIASVELEKCAKKGEFYFLLSLDCFEKVEKEKGRKEKAFLLSLDCFTL